MATLQCPTLRNDVQVVLPGADDTEQIVPVKIRGINMASGFLFCYLSQRRREWKASLISGALALASVSLWLFIVAQLS